MVPGIVLYKTRVDPLKEDSLGRLLHTKQGLKERNWLVLWECKSRGISLSLRLCSGYSKPITHTVEAYAGTYLVVKIYTE